MAPATTSIAVLGGCGHVGLPLALEFAKKGHQVTIVDVNAAAVAAISRGAMPFLEGGAEALLRAHMGKNLRATTDAAAVRDVEVVVCIIGTPIDEHLNPQVDELLRAVRELEPHLRAGQLFVLRSTVYPGATQRIAALLDRAVPGIDVAFCPERVAQGHALREFEELPQLVSGVTPRARERAQALFACMTEKLVPVEPLEAELGKLFCNAWRYIQFAAANQFYSLCVQNGVDFYRVWEAITRDYPRLAGFPRAGFAAGPCLFKDTMQLAAFYNNDFTLGQSAMLVNEGLPRILMNHLRHTAAPLGEKTVGILGMAFKGDNDDTRESLAFKMKKLLSLECKAVLCTDELARGPWHVPLERVLAEADLLVIGAPHTRYKALAPRQPVLDPWNLLGRGGLLGVKVLVTGSAGFIAGYVVEDLLEAGHEVVGLDNFSKYGPVEKSYDRHPRYRFTRGDAKDVALLGRLIADCDHALACAAMIGGITYFHTHAYDLLAENERIIAATFDAALGAFRRGRLKKITVLSSSMVFEGAREFPTPEGAERRSPPPLSTYGFQKLACEYFAQGAREQYGLPYTIIRPFNCVGVGERRALTDKEVMSGNVSLAMSHVVPDLVQKVARGQDPLHLLGQGNQVRHYTYGGDLARGIRVCLEHPAATNEDFNLSTPVGHTVLELAAAIWARFHPGEPLRHVCDPAFKYDVQRRVPDVEKARRLLGYEATTPLERILDEVVPWVTEQLRLGTI